MGWNDRSYYRDDRIVRFGGGFNRHSATTWIIIINAVVFILGSMLHGAMRGSFLSPYHWGTFSIDAAVYRMQLWRWFTFQFLHADLLHVFFNMLAMYFFGPMLEHYWGRTRFVAFYLACGLTGGLLFVILGLSPELLGITPSMPLVGASGGVFGVLVGAAAIAPDQRLLFPPMKIRTLVLAYLGLSVLAVVIGSRNAGGDAAHLGGMAMGFLLMKQPRLLAWINFRNLRTWRDANRWHRQQKKLAEEEEQINRILTKVKEHGLHSLNRREKKLLQRETDRLRSSG